VFETTSNTLKQKKNMFCYENDTVKVLYDFWSQQGLIKFEIFNKTKQPIYVDWKKSSYISNKFKLNYYRDGETIESKSLLANYYFKPNYTPNEIAMGSTSSIVTKDERITFIPPNSKIQKAQFYILPISRLNMSPSTFFYETERNDNPTKKTIIYLQNYTEENSPIAFINHILISMELKKPLLMKMEIKLNSHHFFRQLDFISICQTMLGLNLKIRFFKRVKLWRISYNL
jgi:hypothetical protein